MSRYKELIDDWRSAAARTRDAQQRLKAAFEAHLAGGPAPADEEVAHLRELRAIEAEKLELAMAYMKRTAHDPPTTPGELI